MRRVIVAACVVSATAALVAPAQNSAAPAQKAVQQTIRTVARGIAPASGAPFSLAVDASGKVYVAVGNKAPAEGAQAVTDPMTNRVFVLSPDGAMKAIVGSGSIGSVGDGGAAIEAELNLMGSRLMRSGIAVDVDDNIFIADTLNQTIRRVAGPESTEPMVIRSAVGRWAGPSNFELAAPAGLATDRAGNLYTADAAASAIYALRGGKLELLAQVAAPGAIAVDSAGTRVYVASPAQGRVFAVDTAGVVVNGAANQDRRPDAGPTTGGIRVVAELAEQGPAGLAVDAAGNLFMADGVANVIRRIDARTGVSTIVAGTGATGDAGDGGPATRAELNAPAGLAFDAAGNLFVADEGNRSIREITNLGPEQASGSVTLSPASINFGDQLTGGTTASQAFTLTNGTSAALTGISISFTGANPGDFSSTNSCGSMLAAMLSCHINVTFAPHSTGVRSATLSVADSDPSTPQTASVSGAGDDFELVPQSASSLTTLNIISGATATFMLAVKPDSIFSGKVTFVCPGNLPAQTTCTFSPASVAVTPGFSQNFTAAFATAVHQIVPGANERQFPAPPCGWLIVFAAIIVLAVCERHFLSLGSCPSAAAARRGLALAMALGTALAFAGGCYKKKYKPVTGTQAGPYGLTVNGIAQNASRGITVTINVQ